ncbi:MAG: tRNA (guanosine(37)-N1)-methyltransferase TrmD [Candidatus Harrisonbacteria bacterium CG10_big_fil_rev_8_21_14_0_10_49_15]|uniref:tRNA (guanine-N(1)-)-methyltransferase n=1 Tax=Candidatus Harrisonbacteria bacterium CG10_big_fil_rev_8_21_14_0_10_49_15 TaxID=1974587 RepID=A0A2H0UL79_9BACT|nr:MAG: tRNA (guanosine(37)-N1)-methyltransferase TrmD [Candidatus Harrisonbacteria bacterium CG10_big_fil_rev_8_21_14_0_10_49_15]
MKFDILTIFPEMLDAYFNESILGRASQKKLISIKTHNIRDFTKDKHRKVDDRPFGGGAGMVMLFEPIAAAVTAARSKKYELRSKNGKKRKPKARVILFSTRGKVFNDKEAKRLAKYDQLIFICGRYEGVDERVADVIADEELSIGDFVLTGGEAAAMVAVDAVARKIPGVLGKAESLEEVQGSYPTYSRPEVIEYKKPGNKHTKKLRVPKVLLSGDHKKINDWRRGSSS